VTSLTFLPRHTGEGREGESHREDSGNFRSEISETSTEVLPLRPFGPPPPYDGGGK
jgi:hypothetical protein